MDRGTLGNIEHLGLDKCLVNILSHFAAKSVNLTYQMTL